MSKWSQKSLWFILPSVGLVATLLTSDASAGHRRRSDVIVTQSGGTRSSFCTDGGITVVHSVKAEPGGAYSIGFTTLEGAPGTFQLGEGSRVIPRGCYSHWLSNTVAAGRTSVESTVWYD
jgi:hypothetical protein